MKAYGNVSISTQRHPFPDWIDQIQLAAGVAKSYTVPATASVMVIGGSALFYIAPEGRTAVVPAADLIDGTGVIPCGGGDFDVKSMGNRTISLIAPAACDIGIMLFK